MFKDIENFSLPIPFKCPLNCCNEELCSSTLLIHLIKSHQIEVKEVQENEKIKILMNGNCLKVGDNFCLGILVIKSDKFQSKNALLPFEYRHYENHLPILIMTSCDNYAKLYGINTDCNSKFLSFWFSTPTINDNHINLFSTITLHDQKMKKSLSSLIKVRKVENSQKIIEFMDKETDHLTTNIQLLKTICFDLKIYIETSLLFDLI